MVFLKKGWKYRKCLKRLQHVGRFRPRQSRAFLFCVATGNEHYASDKLVAIRNSTCDRSLGVQRHALGEHDRHARATGMRL